MTGRLQCWQLLYYVPSEPDHRVVFHQLLVVPATQANNLYYYSVCAYMYTSWQLSHSH